MLRAIVLGLGISGLGIATLPLTVAQSQPAPANPQAPEGQSSPTAPNAQGMMTDPGPNAPTQAPSGVPGSQNVNEAESPRPMGPANLTPQSPAPVNPPAPSPAR